jgi:hypothetical protein
MDTDAHGLETNLTEAVIGSAFEVSKALGAGSNGSVSSRTRSCKYSSSYFADTTLD